MTRYLACLVSFHLHHPWPSLYLGEEKSILLSCLCACKYVVPSLCGRWAWVEKADDTASISRIVSSLTHGTNPSIALRGSYIARQSFFVSTTNGHRERREDGLYRTRLSSRTLFWLHSPSRLGQCKCTLLGLKMKKEHEQNKRLLDSMLPPMVQKGKTEDRSVVGLTMAFERREQERRRRVGAYINPDRWSRIRA